MTPIHHLFTSSLLAQTPTATGSGGVLGNPLVMMVALVVMMYFLMIRPQQRQRKEMAARIAALQTGDKVVTLAGIHGIVQHIKEHTIMVKVAEGTAIEFDKSAIGTVHKKESSAK